MTDVRDEEEKKKKEEIQKKKIQAQCKHKNNK